MMGIILIMMVKMFIKSVIPTRMGVMIGVSVSSMVLELLKLKNIQKMIVERMFYIELE